MSNLPSELPSNVGQVSSAWLAYNQSKARTRSRRNSSLSSLSSIRENDVPEFCADRRGSAPEWVHISRFLQARKSTQTLPEWGPAPSSRRGSYPCALQGLDRSQMHIYGVSNQSHEQLRDLLLLRRHSLKAGDLTWRESTMTLDRTTSMDNLSGRHFRFKIILLGDSGVGKSSFLQTLLNGTYTASMPNTNLTMANAMKTLPYYDLNVELHFSDTAGQERYRSITASFYRHAQGCLLFFNVNYKLSFEHVESWLEDLKKYCRRDNLAVVLVGLTHKYTHKPRKRDSKENVDEDKTNSFKDWSEFSNDCDNSNRAVPRGQAEDLANNNSIPYLEADIQNVQDVSDITYKLLDLLMCRAVQHHQESIIIKPQKNKPSCTFCLC